MAGIYVHVPFCKSKCTQCDFASYPKEIGKAEAYFACLYREIKGRGLQLKDKKFDTVYFGGGTPSIVDPNLILGAMRQIRECLNLSDNEEICIETEDTETISLETRYNSIFEWQKYCGDFGMEQLIFLNEQCVKYEIPVEIMLALICTESSFRSDARASTSSASGYCQIIRSTAQWIYEDKLGYGTYDIYNHEAIMTTNWRLNIEIACRLIYCLYWNSDQSWDIAIQKYYGGSEQACLIYLNTVNKNMSELFNLTTKNFK